MNTVEEKLWNYIDGTCTPAEHEAINLLIQQDEVYKQKYNELLILNSEFAAMELDEPPMAFTYNVMETIRNEHARTPLKAAIDKRIIKGIGIFFAFIITALLVVVLANVSWNDGILSVQNAPKFTMPDVSQYFKGPVMQGFWFFDLILALYFTDNYLRKKRMTKIEISVQSDIQQK